MVFSRVLRRQLSRLLGVRKDVVLERGVPELNIRLQKIGALGLYLHIPFCRQICPYCPYNKELYDPATADRYAVAVMSEVERYGYILGSKPITSFYIGGGTPTTMLRRGLPEILEHIRRTLNLQCDVHMESHPNDLSPDNVKAIRDLGVEHLSTGVEALQDRHLATLCRPYTARQARGSVERAVRQGFRCVNADIIFALPNQTCQEVEEAARVLLDIGVDQVATYPLFSFPYTRWQELVHAGEAYSLTQKRRMLRVVEEVFYAAGFERTSVWAFTRAGVPKYCSVTVPLYLGLGASGGSYLEDVFYLNTFSVREYIDALERGVLPIALSLELNEAMQMAGWLYWRVYETRWSKKAFRKRFGKPMSAVYGRYLTLLSLAGLLRAHGDDMALSDAGAYWLHALQDLFSIHYVSELWGTSGRDPWPERVVLS